MKHEIRLYAFAALLAAAPMCGVASAQGQVQKPNIILIVSDDFGYGDSGPYGGGPGRGMPTPNIDRLANEGMSAGCRTRNGLWGPY
jgi:arylsulfatase